MKDTTKKEPDHLTKRESEILLLIIDGKTGNEIADKLFISYNAVCIHRTNIHHKTNCKNTAELVKYIAKNGLL